ncbi:aminoacyl-tRNA hydrolase [Peptococcaceae bacterium 1198_IL3148]
MKMIVGLGNPGPEYAKTRHNVGFMLVDKLAESLKVTVNKSKNKALIGETQMGQEKILLVKPQTYMNLSGEAVGALARWYKLTATDIIVIYDDMDLPLGKLRIRPAGGSGGHNGMKSIIAALGTEAFPRMRIGIGKNQANSINHVLGKFNAEEMATIDATIEQTMQAVQTWVRQDINASMNKYNR